MDVQLLLMLISAGIFLLAVLASHNLRILLKHCIFRPGCECKFVYQGKYLKSYKD